MLDESYHRHELSELRMQGFGRENPMAADLIVRALSQRATTGTVTIGTLVLRCGLGLAGSTYMKQEGDGATPIGRWRVLHVLYRPDHLRGFYSSGMLRHAKPLRADDGWCDASGHRNYNRPVRHPYPETAEVMWRDDHLYDVVVVLDHNHRPRVQGHGSAIFMHLARPGNEGRIAPTAGCVSLARRDLAIVLRMIRPGAAVRVVV
jgi:L,D-peptidoglycan transpeptidase YkuD (ErfK/YbiS/YcfS/YnhG family)